MDFKMKIKNYGFVYIWFDKLNKMYYVGCHWGTLDDGYICSSRWMNRAYKNRKTDFKRRILKSNLTRIGMYEEEQRYLDMIKPEERKIKYYNLCLSSNNLWHKYPDSNLSIGQRISASKTGKSIGSCSPERAKAISEGKKKAIKKRGGFSAEHKAKISAAKIGYKHTEEWKQNNSKLVKEQWASGARTSNGPLREDHKAKISNKLTGIKRSDEFKSKLKDANQKTYEILFFDNTKLIVTGLKEWAISNNISKNTIYKVLQDQSSCRKHNIQKIHLI